MSKVLFVLKRKADFNSDKDSRHIGLSTGLYNSASFVNQMLYDMGIESNLEVVIDNNSIDRVVTQHRPTHVIIEALWVVPEKFEILQRLHPNVTWILRLHSEIPFMAGEGMAMDWIGEYSKIKNMIISVNSPRMLREVGLYLKAMHSWTEAEVNKKLIYLPNYYPQEYKQTRNIDNTKPHVDVSCFGAVRPLKNHLLQAIAAVDFAERIGKKLRFHINSGRVEMNGQPALRNLEGLFVHLYERGHRLVNHEWKPREEFLEVCADTDIGMQCNFSETFNIVGADLISQGVPLIGTKEIPWLSCGQADPTDSKNIVNQLEEVYYSPGVNVESNQTSLTKYTNKTANIWKQVFGKRKLRYERKILRTGT